MNHLIIDPQKDYLLIPGLVWSCIPGEPAGGLAVYISRGAISRVIPASSAYEGSGENMEVINMPEITLMPGLVDCHVHFSMDCENLFQAIDDWENRPQLVEQRVLRAAADYLSAGVVAVRDGSDRNGIGLRTRDNINAGCFPGPLVAATGRAIFRKGSYGDFLGPGITDIDEALDQVSRLKAEDIDQLKVVVSGLVSFREYGNVGPVQFTVPELRKIAETAHGLGISVMAHASSAAAVETCVLAGVDSVEHGYFLETRQLELMARKGTSWVPTLSPLGNLVKTGSLPYEGAVMDVIRRSFETQLLRVKEACEIGVALGIGTDAGANHVFHGSSYHDELGYYLEAGLDTKTVVSLATSVSAKIAGLGDRIGSITPGKQPYLVGIETNPQDTGLSRPGSLKALKNPAWVITPGSCR